MLKQQKNLKILNSTKRKIDTIQWNKWANQYAKILPISVQIIYMRDYQHIISTKIDEGYIRIHRGGLYNKEIYVVVNKYETQESLSWIFLHELAHWIIAINQKLITYIDAKEQHLLLSIIKRKISKEMQEEISYEECFADMFATVVLGKDFNNNWLNKRSKSDGYY